MMSEYHTCRYCSCEWGFWGTDKHSVESQGAACSSAEVTCAYAQVRYHFTLWHAKSRKWLRFQQAIVICCNPIRTKWDASFEDEWRACTMSLWKADWTSALRALRSWGWRRRTSGPSVSSSPSFFTFSLEPLSSTHLSRTARVQRNVCWRRSWRSWSRNTVSPRMITRRCREWCSSRRRTAPAGSGNSPALFTLPLLSSQQLVRKHVSMKKCI